MILVTTSCWWICDGDSIKMLVTKSWNCDFFCYFGDFSIWGIGHQHLTSVINIWKLSSTHFVSNIRHQHWCVRMILTKKKKNFCHQIFITRFCHQNFVINIKKNTFHYHIFSKLTLSSNHLFWWKFLHPTNIFFRIVF